MPRKLLGKEEKEARNHLELCAKLAREKSTCFRKKCGAVIVANDEVVGTGFNSPPGNLESQRRCGNDKTLYHTKITDKTCCEHAERRAMSDAPKERRKGASLYYAHVDKDGNLEASGRPYCTRCSKDALDEGIAEFILMHKDGIYAYSTEEYNDLSYAYVGNS